MKTDTRVVVIGGGMMGASLLYHLALEGWTDCVLIEKSELTSGSTWHAAGQCPSIVGGYSLAKIHAYSNELYPKLEALTGQYTSWHPSGGLRLANNDTELAWLKQVEGVARSIGFFMEIVGVEEMRRLHPFLNTEGVLAAAYTRDDGHGDPAGICNALAKAARDLGATIVRRNRVLSIESLPSGEWLVITEQGPIRAEHVVNAAGCYAREVGAMVGVEVPILNMQHHYVVTHPIEAFKERSGEIPVVRDSRCSGYLRQEQKSGLMGIYESSGLTEAWAARGGSPEWASSNELFPDDLERIAPRLELAIERIPVFGEAGIRRIVNGAIPHTPDSAPLLGPAAGVRNFWMCCGTSFGIAQGGGCGKYLAQWMVHGAADINMTELDPRRFGPFADRRYVRAKVFLDYRSTYVTRGPNEEEPDGRPAKTSPLYERLSAQGCVHTETFGWERPRWFSPDGRTEEYSYRRNNVFEVVREEVRAVHERVGLLDLTGFAKFDIEGRDAEAFLNRVCANRMPRRTGGIALVHTLSAGGRILGEMTVTRLADDRFYALSAAAAQIRDLDWLGQSVLPGEDVRIVDLTEAHGVLVLSGPRSRELLARLTDAPLDTRFFPWLSGREIRAAGYPVRALRVSYVGELGYELHAPLAALAPLYDALMTEGASLGIANYGLYAVNSLRLEKAYKGWGSELTNELNLLEADMARFFPKDKADFVGKAATLAQAPRPLRIVYLEVEASDADARGSEPVLKGGRCIGLTTSGGYGHRVKKSLAFAAVEPEFAAPGSTFEVLIQSEARGARVLAAPAFDPDNARMRV